MAFNTTYQPNIPLTVKYRLGVVALLMLGVIALFLYFFEEPEKDSYKSYVIRTEFVQVSSLNEIVLVKDSLVKPILYSHIPDLEYLPVPRAKAIFISVLLPSILVSKHTIELRKAKIEMLNKKKEWSKTDSAFYLEMKKRYKAINMDNLTARMGSMPNSIVLAQAAVESGWGQSRFFQEGNNVFGIWSFNTNEPRIKAGLTRKKKSVYLRSYNDMSECITDYFEMLGSERPYRSLRSARLETKNPFELLHHLKFYSERRAAYTAQLKTIIVKNNLTQYDHFKIDPMYFVEDN